MYRNLYLSIPKCMNTLKYEYQNVSIIMFAVKEIRMLALCK